MLPHRSCRAGHNPLTEITVDTFPGILPRNAPLTDVVGRLKAFAAWDPAALATIGPAERNPHGIGAWPNDAKLAALYAEVLPQAMTLYHAQTVHWPKMHSRRPLQLSTTSAQGGRLS